MEIDQRQQLEMAEVIHDLYNFAHPTPVSLHELSAIAVSLEIWRLQVKKYRQSGTLTELDPKKESISLKTALPDLPSKIYKTIEAYFTQFGRSLEIWLIYHHARVHFRYDHKNLVLNDFADFVCDYLGKIDYVRTAERMMSCDRFDVDVKFIIACVCFFEDDIRRLWPSVSSKMYLDERASPPLVCVAMNLDLIDFELCPQLYYWVERLTNPSDNMNFPVRHTNEYVEEEMFDQHRCNIRSSLEYFWDRLPRERQMLKAIYLHDADVICFISIILPKLDDQQLDEFVKRRGRQLIVELFGSDRFDEGLVLRTWFYIRNIINETSFARMMVEILDKNIKMTNDHEDDTEDEDDDEKNDNFDADSRMEVDDHEDDDNVDEYRNEMAMSDDDDDDYEDDDTFDGYLHWRGAADLLDNDRVFLQNDKFRQWNSYSHLCREIWNNAPQNLKRSMIECISADNKLLKKIGATGRYDSTQINVELLLLILRCGSFEERCSFWQNNWHLLIAAARGDDLQRIMVLCFENEHQINEFKQNIMASSENVRVLCFELLRKGEYFDYLTELVSFVWPEMQNAMNFKQQILRECFLDARPRFEAEIVRYHEKFDDFIADAYDSVDLSNDFKNQLISSSAIQNVLWQFICKKLVSVEELLEFLGTYAMTEEALVQVKINMIGCVKAYVNNTPRGREYLSNRPEIKSILLWCLGSEEEVDEFKLNCIS